MTMSLQPNCRDLLRVCRRVSRADNEAPVSGRGSSRYLNPHASLDICGRQFESLACANELNPEIGSPGDRKVSAQHQRLSRLALNEC